jgi:hypothetical protein
MYKPLSLQQIYYGQGFPAESIAPSVVIDTDWTMTLKPHLEASDYLQVQILIKLGL